jgi:hypothetical protein
MEEHAQKASGVLGFAGLILGAVQNFADISTAIGKHFWLVLFVALILAVYSLWPDPSPPDNLRLSPREAVKPLDVAKRYLKIIAVVFVSTLIAGHHIWEMQRSVARHRLYPNPTEILGSIFAESAYASNRKPPSIIDFSLIDSKTSFKETTETFFANAGHRDKSLKTFELSTSDMESISQGNCTPAFDIRQDAVRNSIKQFAEEHGRENLVEYIPETPDPLANLVNRRPDITKKLLPRPDEWAKMNADERADILFFIKNCIGIPYPVFQIVIQNHHTSDLVVTAIVYHVRAIGQVSGGESGPLGPAVTYVHKIDYRVGDQKYNLDPPFRIASNAVASFALQIWTDKPDVGLTWDMNIRLMTSQGTIETDEFQLIMSGEPEWHKPRFK